MTKKIDPDTGLEMDIDLNASNSLVIIKPEKFRMQFTPRSPERREVMLEQWKEAEGADCEERAAFRRIAEKARMG